MLQIRGQKVTKKTISQQIISQKITCQSNLKISEKPPLPPNKSMSAFKIESNVKTLRHEYLCDERKENILTAKFLTKKKKLFEITRQNVRLFQKINSQKSIYSHHSLNKSYESNKSIMNSRMSQNSNRSLKNSQISNVSKGSSKSKVSEKKKFFNRATSAKSKGQQNDSKIIIRDVKRRSMINLKSSSVHESKP